MVLLRTASLFALTALAEIGGCYLVWLWVRGGRSAWLLAPAALGLAVFAGLLTLHPLAAGRTYAAYAGMYLATALAWLWAVEGIRPDRWDVLGAAVSLVGMGIMVLAPRS